MLKITICAKTLLSKELSINYIKNLLISFLVIFLLFGANVLYARYYDAAIGRFISTDSVGGEGPNRYAYCANNPVFYTDPTGHVLYVYGSDVFISGVIEDLNKIAPGITRELENYQGKILATISPPEKVDKAHKIGTKFVADLAGMYAKYVLIQETNTAGEAHCAPTGKNAKVAYKPGVSLDMLPLYTGDDCTIKTGIPTPSQIILGHELCHAHHHTIQGGFSTIGKPESSDYGMYWARHYFFTNKGLAYERYRSEEFPTVGFYPWVGLFGPSENALRRESGLTGRASYLSPGSSYQYFSESEMDKMSTLQARIMLLYSINIADPIVETEPEPKQPAKKPSTYNYVESFVLRFSPEVLKKHK